MIAYDRYKPKLEGKFDSNSKGAQLKLAATDSKAQRGAGKMPALCGRIAAAERWNNFEGFRW